MKDRERVAARCRQMRLKAGLSFVKLERLTGLALSTLYGAEHAGRVSPRTADRLAKVFGCNAENLITVGESPWPDRRLK